MAKKLLFNSIIFFVSTISYTQSFNGQWKGNAEHSIWMLNPNAVILEIEVYNDSILSGVIHGYYKKNWYDHTKITGVINWKDSIMNITEENEISTNVDNKIYETCLGIMRLKLSKLNNNYHLEGKWKDKSKKLIHCPTLSIWFEKPFRDSLKEDKQLQLMARQTDIQKVIELSNDETDSIKCELYDNGIVDNDTSSIYFNDKLILSKQRVSEKPIEFYLSFDTTRSFQKLKLVAENLGSIPPNTALLIINTRKKRYTVQLSSDFAKNASVEFFLKD